MAARWLRALLAARSARRGRGELPRPDTSIHPVGGKQDDPRGANQLRLLRHYGLTPSSAVLEIGCGVGRLAYELAPFLAEGRYVGVDISPKAIAWLDEHYAPRLANFSFDLIDVHNPRYHPSGRLGAEEIRFPYDPGQFDVVCAFAVFMHITLPEISNYLQETARMLAPDGIGVVTFRSVQPGEVPPPARGRDWVAVGGGVHTIFPELEGRSLAYDDALIRSTITAAGLRISAAIEGQWHGNPADESADLTHSGPHLGGDVFVVQRAAQ